MYIYQSYSQQYIKVMRHPPDCSKSVMEIPAELQCETAVSSTTVDGSLETASTVYVIRTRSCACVLLSGLQVRKHGGDVAEVAGQARTSFNRNFKSCCCESGMYGPTEQVSDST